MKIVISDEALKWFKEDMEVKKGESIRFFARYGGSSPLQEGFSLGVTKEDPDEVAFEIDKEGVRYYIESRDVWFFDGHDLIVEVNEKLQELSYSYRK